MGGGRAEGQGQRGGPDINSLARVHRVRVVVGAHRAEVRFSLINPPIETARRDAAVLRDDSRGQSGPRDNGETSSSSCDGELYFPTDSHIIDFRVAILSPQGSLYRAITKKRSCNIGASVKADPCLPILPRWTNNINRLNSSGKIERHISRRVSSPEKEIYIYIHT